MRWPAGNNKKYILDLRVLFISLKLSVGETNDNTSAVWMHLCINTRYVYEKTLVCFL